MKKTEQQRAVAVALSNYYKAQDRLAGAKSLLSEALTLIGEDSTKYSVLQQIDKALEEAEAVEEVLSQAKIVADTLAGLKAQEPKE